jgi:chromosome segregation ATPase
MKTKLVLWGNDAEEKRILIAMELKVEENKVNIYTFPEAIATEEFADKLMKDWRSGAEVEFPEGHTVQEKELSVTESLLDDTIKVERSDLVMRAQTEWHFIVLSQKMSHMFDSELSDLKTRIEKLESFDDKVWEELKSFWGKVQQQVREKNLFREHADNLRDNTNELFSKMKELRSKLDREFKDASKEVHDKFHSAIDEVEEKMEKGGARLQALFEELKNIQKDFKGANLTREHRSSVWEKLDSTFKSIKVKRFGDKAGRDSNPLDRIQKRLKGLIVAIEKMEKSIHRDKDDLSFQQKRADTSDGQLEAQIRQAKIIMIEERIRSKEEKLGEMKATQKDLESKIAKLNEKAAAEAEKEKIEAAKEAVKEKIASEIQQTAEELKDEKEDLEKAAKAISDKKEKPAKKDDSVMEAVSNTLSDTVEDAVDTFKAIASVVGKEIDEAVEDLKEKIEDAMDGDDEEDKKEDKKD